MKAINIVWDTDGEEVSLPNEVEIKEDVDEEDIADYLSDEFGYCVESFAVEKDLQIVCEGSSEIEVNDGLFRELISYEVDGNKADMIAKINREGKVIVYNMDSDCYCNTEGDNRKIPKDILKRLEESAKKQIEADYAERKGVKMDKKEITAEVKEGNSLTINVAKEYPYVLPSDNTVFDNLISVLDTGGKVYLEGYYENVVVEIAKNGNEPKIDGDEYDRLTFNFQQDGETIASTKEVTLVQYEGLEDVLAEMRDGSSKFFVNEERTLPEIVAERESKKGKNNKREISERE